MTFYDLDLGQRSLLPLILGTGLNDPYPIYEFLLSTHPVYRDASGIWLVSPHALVTRVLGDHNFSAGVHSSKVPYDDPLGYLSMVAFQSGDRHDRLRRMLVPLLTKKRLVHLQQFIDAEVVRLVTPLRQQARFDVVANIARILPARTICHLLGFPESAAETYPRASMGASQLMSGVPLRTDERNRAIQNTRFFVRQIESVIAQLNPQATPDHPLLYFRKLEDDGELSHCEMLANIMFLFIAGYGTTLLSIGNTIATAMRHPSIWHTLRANHVQIPQAVRELLRYDPAVQAVFRHAANDVELGGRYIRRGEQVALLLGAANRDPAEFPSPNEIDPHRAGGQPLTFGAGPHSCVGLMLARMQIESLMRELLRQMPDLTLHETGYHRLQRGIFHGFTEVWLNSRGIVAPHSK